MLYVATEISPVPMSVIETYSWYAMRVRPKSEDAAASGLVTQLDGLARTNAPLRRLARAAHARRMPPPVAMIAAQKAHVTKKSIAGTDPETDLLEFTERAERAW